MHRTFSTYACLLWQRNQMYKFYVQKGNFFGKLLQNYQKEGKIGMGGEKQYEPGVGIKEKTYKAVATTPQD